MKNIPQPSPAQHLCCGSLKILREANLVRLRRQRQVQVQRLHDLGPAPLGHFLDELGAESGCGASIDRLLSEYSRVDPAFVRALGGDRFPRVLHAVEKAPHGGNRAA